MRCFDTVRAMSTIKQICAVSRFMSPWINEHSVTKEYLQEGRKRLDVILPEFENLGYQVNLQDFSCKEMTATNALITTKSNTSNTLLFTGHHDYCAGLGAEDNATALAIMLELGRCLAGEEMNIAFSSFDLEEFGLQGSRYFVSSQAQEVLKKNFAAVIALECLGSGKELAICEATGGTKSDSAIVADLSAAAQELKHDHIKESFDWYSDHIPFARQGIKTAELCSLDANEYHLALAKCDIWSKSKTYNVAHTIRDIPENIHPETINAAGETLLQFIRNR